jgi:hypothetical protein
LDSGAAEQLIKLVVEVVVPFSDGPFFFDFTYVFVPFWMVGHVGTRKKPSEEVKN